MEGSPPRSGRAYTWLALLLVLQTPRILCGGSSDGPLLTPPFSWVTPGIVQAISSYPGSLLFAARSLQTTLHSGLGWKAGTGAWKLPWRFIFSLPLSLSLYFSRSLSSSLPPSLTQSTQSPRTTHHGK